MWYLQDEGRNEGKDKRIVRAILLRERSELDLKLWNDTVRAMESRRDGKGKETTRRCVRGSSISRGISS